MLLRTVNFTVYFRLAHSLLLLTLAQRLRSLDGGGRDRSTSVTATTRIFDSGVPPPSAALLVGSSDKTMIS